MQKIVAGRKAPEADRKAADIDGDGDISVSDIAQLQKFIAGRRVTLVPEKESFNGHTYQAVDKSMTWADAKSCCEKMGGTLIHVWGDHDDVIRHNDWDYAYTGFVCEWEPSELSAV
ncbi:MAG: hypothetical protein K6B74_04650 [Ruminococcus sp.]|nr:hypothetical protein [Ruminococcus sp.]